MQKNKFTILIALILIIPLMVSQTVNAEMFTMKALAVTIKNISDINVNLAQNEKFTFPAKVKAQMSNGKISEIAVTWDKKGITTAQAGVYESYGKVKGYSKKIKLTVTVSAGIKQVDSVLIHALQDESISLPATVSATLTDGKTKQVEVIWNGKANTGKTGHFVIPGTVKGYAGKVEATVKVDPKIVSVEKIEKKISVDSYYVLPAQVEAVMSDDTTELVDVKWNNREVNTSNVGTAIVEGTVKGYAGKAYLVLNIAQKTAQDIAQESQKVLLLYIYDKNGFKIASGSGFIVSEDGKVLTNFHVVDGANHIKAVDNSGKYIDVKGIYYYNEKQDLALLQLDSKEKLPYVRLGDSDKLVQGEKIVAIGSPKGLQNTLTEGLVSSIRKDGRTGYNDIQISAALSSGSSGGALFNMNGEVVGVTYAKYNGGENLNFAIPINEAKLIMDRTGTLSPISTIEKYNEETAYVGFENYLKETYDYFWVDDTKINLDSFRVYESKDKKSLEISMYIYDEDGHYDNYLKVMKEGTSKEKEENRIAIQQWMYLPLNQSKKFFPDKELYVGFCTLTLKDEKPSSADWAYAEYSTELKKWVCINTEFACTERNGEYIFKWVKNY